MRVFGVCLFSVALIAFVARADSLKGDALYKAVLTSTPSNLPAGLTAVSVRAITDFDSDAKKAGLTGEVEIKLAGGDEKTFINYYFFSNADTASAWDKQYFEDMHPGKELSDPAGAQCAHFANASGYCDFVSHDLSVVITSRGPAKIADDLMKSANDHLMAIAGKTAETQTHP